MSSSRKIRISLKIDHSKSQKTQQSTIIIILELNKY